METRLPSIASQLLGPSNETDSPPVVPDFTFNAATHPGLPDMVTDVPGRLPAKRSSSRATAFYPRKRATTACQVCRARKTKCDNNRPSCSYCVSVGATCVQPATDLSSFDPASLKILDRLDDLDRRLQELASHSTFPVTSDKPCLSWPGGPTVANPGLDDPELFPPQQFSGDRSNVRDEPGFQAGRYLPLTSAGNGGIGGVLPQRVEQILQWSIWRHGNQFSGGDGRQTTSTSVSPSTSFTKPASLIGFFDSSLNVTHRLLANFFSHVHSKNPILNEESTRRLFKETVLVGIDWSPASCLTLIICALGSLATPFGPSRGTKPGTQAYADSQLFFAAAQKRIGSTLVDNDLISAQCLFLSGVYKMHIFEPTYAWRYFLQALAICQGFSSVVSAKQVASIPGTPPTPTETSNQDTQEQAVYWSAWKSERELRHELSPPDFDIQVPGSALYPPFFPTPPIPAAAWSSTGSKSETQQFRTAWLFYLAEISLRRLRSRVCSEMLALRQTLPYTSDFLGALADMVPEYTAQAQQWRDSLPDELSLSPSAKDDQINQFVLRGQMLNLFEIIYWPFVVASISGDEMDRPIVPSLHQLAMQGLDTHITQIRINRSGFQYRHHGCFFMIRSCARSALVLLAAAKTGSTMPDHWSDFVLDVSKMLSFWEDEEIELTGWRTAIERELTTLVRSPLTNSD